MFRLWWNASIFVPYCVPMNKKLLKYWKNCLLDAEWSNSMFYKEPRVTLAFEDRMPESIPEEDIELLYKNKNKSNGYKFDL